MGTFHQMDKKEMAPSHKKIYLWNNDSPRGKRVFVSRLALTLTPGHVTVMLCQ